MHLSCHAGWGWSDERLAEAPPPCDQESDRETEPAGRAWPAGIGFNFGPPPQGDEHAWYQPAVRSPIEKKVGSSERASPNAEGSARRRLRRPHRLQKTTVRIWGRGGAAGNPARRGGITEPSCLFACRLRSRRSVSICVLYNRDYSLYVIYLHRCGGVWVHHQRSCLLPAVTS